MFFNDPRMQRPIMGEGSEDELPGLMAKSQPLMGPGPKLNMPGQFDTGGLTDLPGSPNTMGGMGVKPMGASQVPQPGFWQKFAGGLGGLMSGGVKGGMQGWKGVGNTPPPPGSSPMWTAMLNKGLGSL